MSFLCLFSLQFNCSEDNLLQAYCCFEEILALNPNFLRSYQHLDNVKNQLVERWHFRMLNDADRNLTFKNAIRNAIQVNGCRRVLDIGTGTGLLSIYAKQMGAHEIIACEDSKVMIDIAQQVLNFNEMDQQINLINKYSCDLNASDIGGRVDLVVTETLDSGVFGEGILQNLIHAKEALLKTNGGGQIIPSRIKLYIAGFESKTIAAENVCINNSFFDLIYTKGFRLVAESSEPYDTENVRQLKDFKLITKTEEAFDCDFNNLDEMKQCLDGTRVNKVRLEYERSGYLDGFVVWFSLYLDETNVIESNPATVSCWDQTIFKLNHRFANMEKLKYLNVTVSCKDGILNLNHYYDYTGKVVSVSQEIIRFINDTEYLNKLEFDFFSNSPKPTIDDLNHQHCPITSYNNVLDFSPFPCIGIGLLKERRAQKLYCSKAAQSFIYFVAACNCIALEQFVFIDASIDVLFDASTDPIKFDVIILSLIDQYGCVNSGEIANYHILKTHKLTANGCMIPHRLELCGQLISSDWLSHVSRVTNPELNSLHISPVINRFQTTHQLNLLCFDHEKLSNPVPFGDIQLDDQFYEKYILIKLKPTDKPINGILYFFKIYFTATATEPITTRRNSSFIKRACFVIGDGGMTLTSGGGPINKAIVHFSQNHGVIKCERLIDNTIIHLPN